MHSLSFSALYAKCPYYEGFVCYKTRSESILNRVYIAAPMVGKHHETCPPSPRHLSLLHVARAVVVRSRGVVRRQAHGAW